MAPKEQKSKKAVKEKEKRVIEDLTFGLKNKNKSSKVKQFIERAEKSIKYSHGQADKEKAKEAKKEAKLAKQLQEEELRILFNEGISGQFGKKKNKASNVAEKLGIAEQSKEVAALLEQFSSDSESDDDDPNDGVIYLEDDEPVAVEVFREKTIEDIIEEQRAKLASEGKVGTPVTAESFAKWRAAKLAKRQADAEAKVKAELTKKKGGKGLSVLSGKELFNFNAALFVDDDAALDATEENALSADTKRSEEEAEAIAKAEAERAQEEQLRLLEIHRLEVAERQRQLDLWRQEALLRKVVFFLGSVEINQAVFELEEKEDLTPFPDLVDIEVVENEELDEGEEYLYNNNNDDNDDENDDDDDDDEEEEEEDDEDDDDEEDNNDDNVNESES